MFEITTLPVISEKALGENDKNVYVFEVPLSASKQSIAEAIEKQYEVKVAGVRTLINKGKPKSSYRKRLQARDGKRKDTKLAYIKLSEGKIIIIEGEKE